MAAIAAILDFGPGPKSNGMILGPYLTPHQVSSKSVKEFFRNTVHKHTNKQTERGENSNLHPSSMAEVNKQKMSKLGKACCQLISVVRNVQKPIW